LARSEAKITLNVFILDRNKKKITNSASIKSFVAKSLKYSMRLNLEHESTFKNENTRLKINIWNSKHFDRINV
jgi:hypothetical protein